MAGILRVFIAFIVHPSEDYAQITTPVLLCFYSRPVFFNIDLIDLQETFSHTDVTERIQTNKWTSIMVAFAG